MADHLPSFNDYHCLIIPGWCGSGDDHWQTHWQRRLPRASRTRVASWDEPERGDWVGALDRSIQCIGSPILLVAHSLGCITVAHWAARAEASLRIAGALLVAPADVERGSVRRELSGFAPIPMNRLPFPSLVVGSTNDLAASAQRATDFAATWGSELVMLDDAGHLNLASGYRHWETGFSLLQRLVVPALSSSA
ncbi:RBBP9/YdeN family alpha/beta hydrolase [Halomonas cupida]|uniref:RBBP9/YdeN family alpha/beta hydrolase n=1 Tax=Halomonas cupida TaxID=44933 RepID=UPI003A945227